jgi:hypothetical protein
MKPLSPQCASLCNVHSSTSRDVRDTCPASPGQPASGRAPGRAVGTVLVFSSVLLVVALLSGCRRDAGTNNPTSDEPPIDMLNGILLVSYDNSTATERGQICIINPDGSDFRALTKKNDSLSFVSAAWSPAMDRLVFVWFQHTIGPGTACTVSGTNGSNAVYTGIADANGRILSILQKSSAEPAPPVWSPDGTQIVVTSRDANSLAQCFVMDASGVSSRQITHFDPASGTVTSPIVYGWESNSELLTCVRNYSSGTLWFEFWRMDLSGVLNQRIFEEKGSYLLMPDSFGDLTVCSYLRPGGITGLLAIFNADSTRESLRDELILGEYGQSYANPKLSPDGKRLSFTIRTATEAKVFVKDLATRSERLVYTAPAVSVCDWR